MTMQPSTTRHGTRISYADLLEMYLHHPDNLSEIAETLGFEKARHKKSIKQKKPPSTPYNPDPKDPEEDEKPQPPITTPEDRPNLPFFYIAKRERTEAHINPAPKGTPAWFQKAEPLEDDEIYNEQATKPAWQALTRHPKLWAKLRQILNQNYTTEEPDIPKLIKHIEQGDTLRQFPFAQRKRRISQLLVLADYADHLRTAQQDYQQLYHELVSYWGETNISWQSIEDHPRGKVSYYQNKRYQQQKWRIPPLNTAVLLLSDCGSLVANHRQHDHHQQWQILLNELKQVGNTVLVLAPAAPGDLQPLNFKGIHTYSWDSNLPLAGKIHQPERQTPEDQQHHQEQDQQQQEDVEKILSALAFTYRIEPQLLRATRQLLNLKVSCEAHCRQHNDVIDDGEFLYIKAQALPKYREQFKKITPTQLDKLMQLVTASHSLLPQSILDYELTTAQKLHPEQTIKGAKASLHRLQRYAKTFQDHANDHLMRCHTHNYLIEQETGGELGAALFSTLHQKAIEAGEKIDLPLPKNVTPQQISRFIDITQATQPYCIYQQANDLLLHKQAQNPALNATQPFTIAHTESSYRILAVESQNRVIELSEDNKLQIPTHSNSISLNTGTENLTLATLSKPDWADNIGRDQQGLFIECQHQGQQIRLYYPEWGGELGYDDYGVYTEIAINGVVQRFRYIAAGRFLMGSPKSEKKRGDDEKQHEVILSQGYWLADTVCTQELWQMVMGENPAYFKEGNQNPVEQVSWEDVQDFLEKLNVLIPQLNAKLPTEAQWEYACRAGTATPFSFGENMTPEQVNYNGNYPYAEGKKGEYREKTVPVTALPANLWGLYQMHGNVWEWCQDWYGKYPQDQAQDLMGAKQGEDRVLRGGSWFSYGLDVRSASRGGYTPDYRNGSMGFRFSLGQATGEAVADRQTTRKEKGSDQRVARAGAARNIGRGVMKQGFDKLKDFIKKKS